MMRPKARRERFEAAAAAWLLLAAMAAGTAGCAGDDGGAGPIEDPACGSGTWTWLPVTAVGTAVSFEPTEAFADLSATDIDGLLAAAGYTGFSPVSYGVRNFLLRYRTQDRGVAREATAVVGVPVGAVEGESRPVMLWLHGSTGFNDGCAPSADPMNGPLPTTLGAALGYVTVAPDYLGMLGFGDPSPAGTVSPYLVMEPTAIASLDAIRATLAAMRDAPQPTVGDPARVVAWGGSQGGHAAFAVDRYAPRYAPELGLVAVAAGTAPIDLPAMGTWALRNLGLASRSLVLAFASMRGWYGLPADLAGVLTDDPPANLASTIDGVMATGCGRGAVDDVDSLEGIFAPAFLQAGAAGDWDAVPPWGCFLRQNSANLGSLARLRDVPILAVFGEVDDLVVTSTQLPAVRSMCDGGARIEIVQCRGKGHQDSVVAAFPYIHAWTSARLAGESWDPARICGAGEPVDCETMVPGAPGD